MLHRLSTRNSKVGPNYSSTDYGGWAATAADNFVVMGSNTYNASRAAIAVVGGCQIARTPEDINYQTTLTGVLIEGQPNMSAATTALIRRLRAVIPKNSCNTIRPTEAIPQESNPEAAP